MSQFGNFHDFCRDSTLPACNLFARVDKSCTLTGLSTVHNLGSVLICAIAVIVAAGLIWLSERKKAAVGRREMQILLFAYAITQVCEIFSIGGFLHDRTVLVWFSALHIGAITATAWILLINAIVGYQLMDDGTPLSVALTLVSALAVFVAVAYVGADTGFGYSGAFAEDDLRNYPLYTLYLLLPLLLIVAFFILESVLVLGVLQETRPMVLLSISALCFIVSQIFTFVISVHICNATDGKIDGALFESAFLLMAVVAMWFFWSSITEDEWPEDSMIQDP